MRNVAAQQRQQQWSVPPAGAGASVAKQAVDVAGIDMQAAKLFVTGIYDLSTRPNQFDKHRAIVLFNQAQEAVTQAELQLADLSRVAQPAPNGALQNARNTMVSAQGELRALAGALNAGGTDPNRIKALYQSIDSATHDLDSAARAMRVDTRLNSP